METSESKFQKYLFVCENKREGEKCCMPEGQKIRESLKDRVKKEGLAAKIRVSRAGCLDVCAEGPNVLLMPDNIWFKRVATGDIDSILVKTREAMA